MKADKFSCFEKKCNTAFAAFKKEYQLIEENATFSIVDVEDTRTPCDLDTTKRLVRVLDVCPFGPMRYSPVVEGLVETSMTCAIAKSDEEKVRFIASIRSSSESQMNMMYSKLTCITRMAHMTLSGKEAPYIHSILFIIL